MTSIKVTRTLQFFTINPKAAKVVILFNSRDEINKCVYYLLNRYLHICNRNSYLDRPLDIYFRNLLYDFYATCGSKTWNTHLTNKVGVQE